MDPLADDGLEYAKELRAENVPVEVQIYPGIFHGFRRMGGALSDARRAIELAAHRMRQALSTKAAAGV